MYTYIYIPTYEIYILILCTYADSQQKHKVILQAPYGNNVDRVVQSVQQLATGWTVRGSNPGGGEIFRICPDRPWGPPSLLYNVYRVFPGVKEQPGRDADPSPPSNAVVKKE